MQNLYPEDATPRILVIDDNPSIHEAFEVILCRDPADEKLEQNEAILFGGASDGTAIKPAYQIDHALSGIEGVEMVRRAIDAGTPYQVAFVDIRMPGMDGVETIERFWQVDLQIQTVICTAYADYRWEDLVKRFGQSDRLLMLKKPFHNIEVMQFASALSQKWFLARQAGMKFTQVEALVAQRTQKLLEFHRREDKQNQELDQTKLRYLTKLASEFRGPLSEIMQTLEKTTAGALNPPDLATVHGSTQKLLRLVDDSVSMRTIELEDKDLKWQELEIVGVVRGLVEMFIPSGLKHGLEIKFHSELNSKMIWTDHVKIEKVLFNVFTHVLARSAPQSIISILLQAEETVINIGLETLPRADIGSTDDDNGVGLLWSQELIRPLGGNLTVAPPGKPTGNESNRLRILLSFPSSKPVTTVNIPVQENRDIAQAAGGEIAKDLPVILLVEEGADIRVAISRGLSPDYSVVEAVKVPQGIAMAKETVPDLVIVGGDFPPGEAVKMCANLKHDEITSHIPVILMATDDSDSSQMRALEAGADDFLRKPFRLPLLRARIDNLIENRRKLHEHFQQLQSVQPREIATNGVDVEFLRRVVEIVEKNIADYEFDVETLARQLGLSRRQLFRKFKALAGCTPNVFMRDIRLKRAAQLLRDSDMTVSEIIYAVGFSDPKYFRNIFRERFGVLPGEYGKPIKPTA